MYFFSSPWSCVKAGCSERLLSNIKSRSLQQTRQIQSKRAHVSRRTLVIEHVRVTSTTLMIRVKLSSARDEFLWPPPSIPRAKRAGDLCFNDALHSCLEPVKMFGFHKSKIYRSNEGCCICKTKSSSSRFTDSSRYEENFSLCFGWVFSPDTAPIPNIPRGMLVEFLSQFGASPNESSRESAGWAHWIRNSIFYIYFFW